MGEQTVQFLVDRGRLESFEASDLAALAVALIGRASLRLEAAARAASKNGDVDGAYAAAYDAYRMAAEPLLGRQGLRATGGDGSHMSVEDAVSAQFAAKIPAFAKPTFERLRRTRCRAHSQQHVRMRRVVILGRGGAGKSTLARELGKRTGLPVIELDTLFWPAAPGTGGRESAGTGQGAGHPVIVAYLPGWPQHAAALIAALRGRLGVLAGRIEHIGSTAIPGMDAKDVLDLQVSVADLDAAVRAFDGPLGALGFERAAYAHDHVPAGVAGDPRQWAKLFWSRRARPGGDVNLHVRVTGSASERLALLFRDWFRAHPEAIPAYASFKRSLAAVTPDLDAYSDVKDPVVDLVITVAETWATSTGWQP